MRERILSFLTLFTSSGTLLCCALPALIAAVAGGASVTSFLSVFPWLVPLSRHKIWIFVSAAIFIVISAFLQWKVRKNACDPNKHEEGCQVASSVRRILFWCSLGVYSFALFFTYGLVPILRWFDQLRGG